MGFLTGDCQCHCDPQEDCFGCGTSFSFPSFKVEWAGTTPTYAINQVATGNRVIATRTFAGLTAYDTLSWDYTLPDIVNVFYSGIDVAYQGTECQWGLKHEEDAHIFRRGKSVTYLSPSNRDRDSIPSVYEYSPDGQAGWYDDDYTVLDIVPAAGFSDPTPNPGGYEIYDPDYTPASYHYGVSRRQFLWFLFILNGKWTLRATLNWTNIELIEYELIRQQADTSYLVVGDGTESDPGGGRTVTYTKTLVCNTDLDGSPITLTTASTIPPQSDLGINSSDPIINDWPTTVTITPKLPVHLQGIGWPP